jgi:hypothetical protein
MPAKKKKPPPPRRDFPGEDFDPFLLLDNDDWGAIEPIFSGPAGDQMADDLANILAQIAKAIESGDADRAAWTLRDGVRFCYLRSRTHRAALELYYRSFTEKLPDIGGPLELIEGAIERASKKGASV